MVINLFWPVIKIIVIVVIIIVIVVVVVVVYDVVFILMKTLPGQRRTGKVECLVHLSS